MIPLFQSLHPEWGRDYIAAAAHLPQAIYGDDRLLIFGISTLACPPFDLGYHEVKKVDSLGNLRFHGKGPPASHQLGCNMEAPFDNASAGFH